jgi:hypothetical protein
MGFCGPGAAREVRFETFARQLRVPVAAVKRQAAKNAEQLCAMAEKADRTGRKVNGYTGKQLRAMALFLPNDRAVQPEEISHGAIPKIIMEACSKGQHLLLASVRSRLHSGRLSESSSGFPSRRANSRAEMEAHCQRKSWLALDRVALDSGEGLVLSIHPAHWKGRVTFSPMAGDSAGSGDFAFHSTQHFRKPQDALRHQMRLIRAYVYKRDAQLAGLELAIKRR